MVIIVGLNNQTYVQTFETKRFFCLFFFSLENVQNLVRYYLYGMYTNESYYGNCFPTSKMEICWFSKLEWN